MLSFLLGCYLAFGPTYLCKEEPKVIVPTAKQDIYLSKLAECESNGSTTIKVFDSNKQYSFGTFQFQLSTFLGQSEKYNLGYSEKDIYDYHKQKYLAHLMLLDGGEKHWLNCTNKIGTKYPK